MKDKVTLIVGGDKALPYSQVGATSVTCDGH